ncbi:hypothetical protein GCM10010249_51530 [Streptomyces roseolilacinus]|uniref:Uncharacterized protein n=3 Tax=Streptomyces TaxID=1883 RepID=A0A918ELQ8_9ACTN|nr:hypothetical protein GCM10010249_51530 [Streptomyces roseolilacinus]
MTGAALRPPPARRPAENHSTRTARHDRIVDMFRYAFLAAPSAVADAPKAAAIVLDGARS